MDEHLEREKSPKVSEADTSETQVEQIEIISQSTASKSNKTSGTSYNDKSRKNYPNQKLPHFEQRYNPQPPYHYNYNPIHFLSQSGISHSHRTNSISYYPRSGRKNNPNEISRNQLYSNYLSAKKGKLNGVIDHGGIGKINKTLKGKNHNQLCFIHPYDKCRDFSNFNSFLTLNLRFLKHTYKIKGGENDEGNNDIVNANQGMMMNGQQGNMRNYPQINNTAQFNYMMNMMTPQNSPNPQMGMMNKNIINMNMNNLNNMNNMNNINQQQMVNTQNNNHYQMGMMMYMYNNTNMKNMINNTAARNNSYALMQMLNMQQMQSKIAQQTMNQIENSSQKEQPQCDYNIQNILSLQNNDSFVHPYIPVLHLSKSKSQDNFAHFAPNLINQNQQLPQYNQESESNFNYTSVPDDKLIEENLKTGRYLTGIIRMNKCQTHGYITVAGLENDILIRGGRNLNQSINLDEVVVELFPIVSWKPLVSKKMRKISYINEDTHNTNNPNANANTHDDNTDFENEDNFKALELNDDREIEEGEYKENFTAKEDRLKYINNKVFNLRPEGRIVKILKSPNKEKEQIAHIELDEKNQIFAFPIDETLPKIFIKQNKKSWKNNDFKKNDSDSPYKNKYFLVKINGWAKNYKCPKGIIVNEIGLCGNIEVESDVLLRQYNIDYTENFSSAIQEEMAKKITDEVIDEKFIINSNRIDLRNEIIFTIDPEKSKDLDDAISVKEIDKEKGLLEIGVHIADSSYYITKDSLLDKEAINRGTSVYLVQKNIPMLPTELSEDICSLMPNKDRLAISCTFRIYMNNGALDDTFKPRFDLSIINSKAKWNYELVQDIIKGKEIHYDDLDKIYGAKPQSEEIFNQLIHSVNLLYKLTKLVRQQRFESGSLMIKNENLHFKLDEDNMPLSFKIEEKNDSHNLIEELMLIANKFCAEFVYDNIKDYALIRRHPYLNDNKFSEIQRYLISNKITVDYEDPQELNKMLMEMSIKNKNKFLCIQHKLKTFMLRAEYVTVRRFDFDELKHCALNFDLYTHFTSPIRRYPDIIVHRQLKDILKVKENKMKEEQYIEDFACYEGQMERLNDKYNSSKQISQKSQRIFQCIWLKNFLKEHPGKAKYKGLIMDINGKCNKRVSNSDIVISLFIPEINMELEWRKEDNDKKYKIIKINFDKGGNELSIDYMNEENKVGNKILKTFDAVDLTLSCVDSIPIDVKCSFELN